MCCDVEGKMLEFVAGRSFVLLFDRLLCIRTSALVRWYLGME
jgi:hypothetical protein